MLMGRWRSRCPCRCFKAATAHVSCLQADVFPIRCFMKSGMNWWTQIRAEQKTKHVANCRLLCGELLYIWSYLFTDEGWSWLFSSVLQKLWHSCSVLSFHENVLRNAQFVLWIKTPFSCVVFVSFGFGGEMCYMDSWLNVCHFFKQ